MKEKMAEKIKLEDKREEPRGVLLLGFYRVGDELEIVSNVDPWVERDLLGYLNMRVQEQFTKLQDMLLRGVYDELQAVDRKGK